MRALVFLFVISLTPLSATASEVITKEDSIRLTRNDQDYVLKVGKEVTMELPLYIGDFFDDSVIFANGLFRNTTDKNMEINYIVSFYDKDSELIDLATGFFSLGPGQNTNYGSAIIKGDEEKFEKIRFYKLNAFVLEVPQKK